MFLKNVALSKNFYFFMEICFWKFLFERRTCALKMGFTFFKSWLEVTSYWLVTLIIFLSVGTCPLPSPGREDFLSGEYIYSQGRTSFKIGGTFFMLMWKLFCPKHLGGRSKLPVHFRLHFFAAKNLYIWMLGFSLADWRITSADGTPFALGRLCQTFKMVCFWNVFLVKRRP